MYKRVSVAIAILVALSMLLAACAPKVEPTQPPAATQAPATGPTKTFKLGVLGPFSGPAARTGQEFRGAAEMAFEAIDYQIGDYKIELVWIDSQSDPAKASQAYEQAVVQDKIQAGILNWHSSVSVACMDIAAKHKTPHFFGFGATELVNEKWKSDPEKYSYWFGKTWPMPAKLSSAYVIALEDAIKAGTWTPAEKTAYIWGEDTDWGRSFGGAIKQQFIDAGWKVVGEDYFVADQTEFYPLLNKIKDLNPAVIAGTSATPPAISSLIKQADEVGLKSLIIADGLGWVGEWYSLTGDTSNYVLDQIPQFASEAAKKWASDFQAKYGIEPSPSAAGQAYDMTNFCIKIAQRAVDEYGELSTDSLYQVGKNELFAGKLVYTEGLIHARYEYNESSVPDPVVGKGYFIFPVLQYTNGVGNIIWPDDWATAKLTPKP